MHKLILGDSKICFISFFHM